MSTATTSRRSVGVEIADSEELVIDAFEVALPGGYRPQHRIVDSHRKPHEAVSAEKNQIVGSGSVEIDRPHLDQIDGWQIEHLDETPHITAAVGFRTWRRSSAGSSRTTSSLAGVAASEDGGRGDLGVSGSRVELGGDPRRPCRRVGEPERSRSSR